MVDLMFGTGEEGENVVVISGKQVSTSGSEFRRKERVVGAAVRSDGHWERLNACDYEACNEGFKKIRIGVEPCGIPPRARRNNAS